METEIINDRASKVVSEFSTYDGFKKGLLIPSRAVGYVAGFLVKTFYKAAISFGLAKESIQGYRNDSEPDSVYGAVGQAVGVGATFGGSAVMQTSAEVALSIALSKAGVATALISLFYDGTINGFTAMREGYNRGLRTEVEAPHQNLV